MTILFFRESEIGHYFFQEYNYYCILLKSSNFVVDPNLVKRVNIQTSSYEMKKGGYLKAFTLKIPSFFIIPSLRR